MAGLKSMPGLQPFPSTVNYLLVKITQPDWTAASLRTAMLSEKIIIRDASNFHGLDERFIRLAVRGRAENQQLLKALSHFLT
jgi:threonine-phosphate decarboxylase